jgi:hypothetical protein
MGTSARQAPYHRHAHHRPVALGGSLCRFHFRPIAPDQRRSTGRRAIRGDGPPRRANVRRFNSCKLDEFAAMFDDGVEFYHDQGGVTLGAAKVVEQVKANICGKARRELIAGSLAVYPMHGFGALLVGRHRFYQPAPRLRTNRRRAVHPPGAEDERSLESHARYQLRSRGPCSWKVTPPATT